MSKVLVLKPKSTAIVGFVYENANDLANLIAFVGKKPVVDVEKGEPVFMYRKHVIKNGSVVFRNEYGDVVKVLPIAEIENVYDVSATNDFKPADADPVKVREKKTK